MCTHYLQVRTVLKTKAHGLRSVKAWLLKGIYNVPGRKTCRKFRLDEFESFWSWPNLQLFIWGGEEFISVYKNVSIISRVSRLNRLVLSMGMNDVSQAYYVCGGRGIN
jgi:hypothetical protein